jgi:hypothetical protein
VVFIDSKRQTGNPSDILLLDDEEIAIAIGAPPPSCLGDIVTAAMLAWTMGSLLAVGLVVVGLLTAYAIYYLVFRLGK